MVKHFECFKHLLLQELSCEGVTNYFRDLKYQYHMDPPDDEIGELIFDVS